MRKLVLSRKKSMVACLAKVRVFVSDASGDFELGGTMCRQLGVLKNGKTAEYEISEGSVRVFVVFSKVAPQRYHSYFDISEGSDTVELVTAPKLNPAMGNPFSIFGKQN